MYLNIHMKRKQVLLKYFPVTEDDWKSRIFQDHTDFPNKLYVCMYVCKKKIKFSNLYNTHSQSSNYDEK